MVEVHKNEGVIRGAVPIQSWLIWDDLPDILTLLQSSLRMFENNFKISVKKLKFNFKCVSYN